MSVDAPEPARVLLVGDPRLRAISQPVADFADEAFQADVARLHATLAHFRRVHGFGRAVAAPQIGIARRFIAVNLGAGPFVVVDPEVTWRSDETFTLCDDCMSFPSLLVRLRRWRSLSLRYQHAQGREHTWEHLDLAASELLQHEIDHLDGVLFTDRAEGRDALLLREVFDADPAYYRAQVDCVIGE